MRKKEKHMKKREWLFVGGILLTAVVLWVALRPGETGTWAIVTVDGQEVARYPLNEDRTVTIGEEAYNTLQIADGAVAVTHANCGDHTCIRTGAIQREGETIVCLPHRLVISIVGVDDRIFDAAVK